MSGFTSLERRDVEDWDKGDHIAFALAGLTSVATRALHENLTPGSRGYVAGYPEKLADDLERWVAMIRAADVHAEPAANEEKTETLHATD